MIPVLTGAKPGYVGKLLSSMEARLVDVDGKDVKRGESGELVSPTVAACVWPRANEASNCSGCVDRTSCSDTTRWRRRTSRRTAGS